MRRTLHELAVTLNPQVVRESRDASQLQIDCIEADILKAVRTPRAGHHRRPGADDNFPFICETLWFHGGLAFAPSEEIPRILPIYFGRRKFYRADLDIPEVLISDSQMCFAFDQHQRTVRSEIHDHKVLLKNVG